MPDEQRRQSDEEPTEVTMKICRKVEVFVSDLSRLACNGIALCVCL